MQDQVNATPVPLKRVPWNKGKVTGAKPPLRPKHVWSIRTKLQIEGRARDLAMFNLAIDSKLRGCEVVAIKVEDIAASGSTADRATIRQKKTGRPVRIEGLFRCRKSVAEREGFSSSIPDGYSILLSEAMNSAGRRRAYPLPSPHDPFPRARLRTVLLGVAPLSRTWIGSICWCQGAPEVIAPLLIADVRSLS